MNTDILAERAGICHVELCFSSIVKASIFFSMNICAKASFCVFFRNSSVFSMCPHFQSSCLASCKRLIFRQFMLKVSSVIDMLCCVPGCVREYFWSVFMCACQTLCICLYFCCVALVCVHMPVCMWMREWDKKEMKSRSEELSHSEASPSVRLGLIVPGCEDMEKSEESNCTRPLSQSYFCNIKRAPPARSRLLPCK